MQEAYATMGISVLSGSITTFGSGVFLFGGKINTFNKFATLITGCIGFSFITAMLLFGSLMHSIGPQNGFGDLDKLFTCCKNKNIQPKSPEKAGTNQIQSSPQQ